jgi:hypothetical protein
MTARPWNNGIGPSDWRCDDCGCWTSAGACPTCPLAFEDYDRCDDCGAPPHVECDCHLAERD